MCTVKLFMFIFLCSVGIFIVESETTNATLTKIHYDLNEAKKLFNNFIEHFHKEYRNKKEYNYRLRVFRKSLEEINKINEESNGVIYGITEFSDLTLDEFFHEHTGFKVGGILPNSTKDVMSRQYIHVNYDNEVPEQWDWRSQGIVTMARHQLSCSSCWSFSAVGCVEGQYAKKYGRLVAFSDQQMVDCYKRTCVQGDHPHSALNAAAMMGGYMEAHNYPYTGVPGMCRFRPDQVAVRVAGGHVAEFRDEEQLKNFVYNYGPVSLGIHTDWPFLYYRGGIANAMSLYCNPYKQINHAVLLIGYGIENGVPYWIIKNSAGAEWGEDGFIRLTRGENACNILSYVAYADIL